MRTILKYFIVFLSMEGCADTREDTENEAPPLYANPISIALNTNEGYTINKITGDTIKPLVNSFGDTIKTGVPVSFKGVIVDSIFKPQLNLTSTATPTKLFIKNNIHPIVTKGTSNHEGTIETKEKVTADEGRSISTPNNSVEIKAVSIPVTEKKMSFREPLPVKALPLRFKDAAIVNVQYLDVDQGMSSSYVTTIIEDRRGNLWFGMDGTGISKYDGVNFIHYTEQEGLSNNFIHSILEDSKGNIWIGTADGLNKFDGKNFSQYKGLPGTMINSIIEDSKGSMWICTNKGITRYDGKGFNQYTKEKGLSSDTVFACTEDKKGNLWFGTIPGVSKFDGKKFTHYNKQNGLVIEGITSLLTDRSGTIWFGSNQGAVRFDGSDFIHYSQKEGLPSNLIWGMLEDKKGAMWIATAFGGINKYDGKSFTEYNLSEGLSNNKVRSMIEDKNGNIWFGTDGGGVNKLNDGGFSYLRHNEVVAVNRVRPIIKDRKGNVWLGTESAGVGRYDADNNATGFTYYTKKEGLPFNSQRSLLEDREGNMWIGSENGGISKYDGKQFINYSEKGYITGNTIFSMLEDSHGNLWIGKTFDGISKYDSKKIIHYTEREGLSGKKIFSMLEDSKRNLWFCTEGGGLNKYDGTNLIIYSEREGLFSNSITSIIEDKKGNLWLGTLGAGLCRFDGRDFTYYTGQQGLSNNNVWSIIEDSVGYIWAGTDKGLNCFIPQAGNKKDSTNRYVIYQFGLQDGLKAIDFNLHSACIDNNNHVWWGTGKNIVTKDLNVPLKTYDVRSLHLNYIEVNERFYDYNNLPDSLAANITYNNVLPFSNCPDKLTLSHDFNHIGFRFSAIDWSAPDKIKYSFRLRGLDEKWSRPSEETLAEYRNLSYGHYKFQVRAIGQSQVWTEPLTYSFNIKPAWWQTWWFRTLIILILLTLVFLIARFIYHYQLRKQRTALEKQLAVQYERQRISTEMHDDIGAGLSGIRLLTEMTKNKVKDENAAKEVEKIYQSVGDISSKMKEVIWSLSAENDTLQNLLSYIQRQARLWLENYPAQLTIELPETIPSLEINGETRRDVLLMVKEAVHNIIKHSGANKVRINMICIPDELTIIVSDNGKGIIEEHHENAGNGTKNMQMRAQKLNGKMFIQNKEGLIVTFEIPLKNI